MAWVQTRRCDGQCCREAPRWPNVRRDQINTAREAGTLDCVYHDSDGGCTLMKGRVPVPYDTEATRGHNDASRVKQPMPTTVDQKRFRGYLPVEVFEQTCVNWPQNLPSNQQYEGKTGGCCWQWVP